MANLDGKVYYKLVQTVSRQWLVIWVAEDVMDEIDIGASVFEPAWKLLTKRDVAITIFSSDTYVTLVTCV